jgi:hypothetical protein
LDCRFNENLCEKLLLRVLTGGAYLRENISYIEERMAQLVPLSIPLRLTCLLAHCSDGLPAADLARLKTQLVQAGVYFLVRNPYFLRLNPLMKV